MTEPQERQFGCLTSPEDRRDYPVSSFLPTETTPLPHSYRLPFTVPVRDQGTTSMCVDFSLRTIKEVQEWVERGALAPFGNGYIYANRRDNDYHGEGMIPREALKTLLDFGIPRESDFNVTGEYGTCWLAYREDRARFDESAKPQRIAAYARCWSPGDAQGALYHLKSPVLVAAIVTRTFLQTGPDGVVADEPAANFEMGHPDWLGGHAMVITGWTRIQDRLYWIVQNSWGERWANGGRCFLPANWGGIYELWTVTDRRPQGKGVRFRIGQPTVEHLSPDGKQVLKTVTIDTAPFLHQQRTQVPLRAFTDAIAELLGVRVAILPVIDAHGTPTHVDLVLLQE